MSEWVIGANKTKERSEEQLAMRCVREMKNLRDLRCV